jgi:arylsulfatase A-like enzyme
VVIVLLESVGSRATSLDDPASGTTPNLARFAAEGLRASNWTTVVPHTSKSIVATMCGTWPYLRAEVREAGPRGLPVRCLPDLLSDLDYRTAFFQTASEEFERRRELVGALGFDRLYARHALARPPFEAVNYFGIEDRAMIAPGVAWSTGDLERPFFAVYLTMATHHDYRTPSTWPTPDLPGVGRERARYVHALRYVDAFLGELVDAYARAGVLDHTVFVFLGDHGEAFGEHGRRHHDMVIWDEVVRVPMVIWGGPLERRGVATGPRQHIDLLPTVLSLAGAELARGDTEGTSIFADVPADRELFHSCWRPFRCLALRRGDEKIVDHFRDRPPERFDLALDPAETRDRPDAARVEAARRAMATWRARVNGAYEAHFAAPHPRAHGAPLADWGAVRLLGCVVAPAELSPGEPTWITCRTSGAAVWRATLRVDGRVVDLRAAVEGGTDPVVRFALPTDPATPLGDHAVELGWTRWSGFHAPRLDADGAFARVGSIHVVPLPGGAQPPR